MRLAARVLSVFLALALCLGPAIGADRRPFAFDKAHSQVNFVAEALFISAHGSFDRFDGDVQIDPENIENSTLSLTIEAASINTRVERRDNHLRTADFFDAQNHPNITFVSTKITKVDDKNLMITGDLTIRGKTKTITAPTRIVFLRVGNDGRFKGEFQVNRHDFGVSYNNRMNPIEDMVTVQFDLHLVDRQVMEQRQQQQRQQPPPPPPAQKPPAK